jgi:hypothetical protein
MLMRALCNAGNHVIMATEEGGRAPDSESPPPADHFGPGGPLPRSAWTLQSADPTASLCHTFRRLLTGTVTVSCVTVARRTVTRTVQL